MDKAKILKIHINDLKKTLATLIESAQEAKEAATNEESKAENKYDTRGLEASYLAGAQAKRAIELNEIVDLYKGLKLKDFSDNDKISVTALIEVLVNDQDKKWLFLLPKQGGSKIEFNKKAILTVTSEAPVGKLLINKSCGDFFELKGRENSSEYEILQVL